MSHESIGMALAIGMFLIVSVSACLHIYFEVRRARRSSWDDIVKYYKDISSRVNVLEKECAIMTVWERDSYNILSAMMKWHHDNNTGFMEIYNACKNNNESDIGRKDDRGIHGRHIGKHGVPKGGNKPDNS